MENLPHKSTQRDFFLYILVAISLYVSVYSFIQLLFTYIGVLLPDKLDYYGYPYDAMTWSISTLVVFFPVFIGISWFLRKDIIANPGKKEFGFRKFFVYLTLFAAAVAIIIDLSALVHIFLKGELTVRFLLKIAVILLTAAAVFGYYYLDIKKRDILPDSKPSKILVAASSLIMAAVIVSGFFIVGNPWDERKGRFDDQRLFDLQNLQGQIINYWQLKEKLPEKLDDLKDDVSGFVPPKDPETDASYEYRSAGKTAFELCAAFTLSSDERKGRPQYSFGKDSWSHAEGRHCFSRTIDPEIHKLRSLPPIEYSKPIR